MDMKHRISRISRELIALTGQISDIVDTLGRDTDPRLERWRVQCGKLHCNSPGSR